jgi:hypothetical protein
MFLPWVGLFEQISLADTYVHYDDVQLPQGRSFMSRVQVKTPRGVIWLTAPIDRNSSGRLISDAYYSSGTDWRERHLRTLKDAYMRAPCFDAMYDLAREIYGVTENNLALFNQRAIETISRWLGLRTRFEVSSALGAPGRSTERLASICEVLGGDVYISGLGALKYLNYDIFEQKGIRVEYMAYEKKAYQQLDGEFTPYVTILDAVAHCGERAKELLCSNSVYWKNFIGGSGGEAPA